MKFILTASDRRLWSISTAAWLRRTRPAEVVNKLNNEINAGLADTKIKARLADFEGTPLVSSPAALSKLITDETEKWGKVVKFTGAKPD